MVAAMAWISSMITVSTPTSVSRADEVNIRYSDSGVVINRSGGRRMSFWRSLGRGVAGAHRHVGGDERLPQPLGGQLDPLERGAQVLLDVERQRPQR